MRTVVLTLALLVAAGLALAAAAGWLDALLRGALEAQRAFQNAMAQGLRALRAGQPGALAGLLGVAFAYGVVHALGPGHGKVLIGGYGAAVPVRAGVLAGVALAASLMQATVAVVLVYGGIALFDLGRERLVQVGEGQLALVSAGGMALIGGWLMLRAARGLWRQGIATPRRLPAIAPLPALASGPQGHDGAPARWSAPGRQAEHGEAPHPQSDPGAERHRGAQQRQADGPRAADRIAAAHGAPAHGTAAHGTAAHGAAARAEHEAVCGHCGHRHGPTLQEAARVNSLRDGILLVIAVGIRPCTGALFLLLLTWHLGLVWAGIAGAYAMGIGTAGVTVGVALLAVGSREGARLWLARALGRADRWRLVVPMLEAGAGLLVIALAWRILSGAG